MKARQNENEGRIRSLAGEIRQAKKKTSEKALIPLPPTGFVSLFCANPDVVQTNLQPRRAVGLRRLSAISFCERFCKEMQRDCTAVQGAVTEGVLLECPVSLGKNAKNIRISVFSKS